MARLDLKIAPVLMIVFAVLMRLLPHPPNFAPIAALALFGGVYLPKRWAFILPIVALLISDYFIGFYGTTMLFVYGSFLLTGLIGLWLKKHKNITAVVGASIVSSLFFYLITNFGVWVDPASWYSKDLLGLIDSYIMAIPFFRHTLLGDLFYTGVFFGSFELAQVLGKKYLPQKLFKLAF